MTAKQMLNIISLINQHNTLPVYTFFFSNAIGKQLTNATITTMVLAALVVTLEYFSVTVIYIAQSALIAYLPFLLVLLILWYVIGHLL